MRPARPPATEAVAMLDRLMEIVHEQWRIHFIVVLGVHVAREVLAERYAELLGGDQLEPYRLLEGLPNATLDADDELAGLAALSERLDVADLIRELPAERAIAELGRLHQGRELLAALDAHLLRFGARSRLHELGEPRYAERPEFVVESIRLLLERQEPPPADRAQRAAERDRLEADVLARVDPAERPGFAELLERVKAAAPLEEGHTLHIDQRGLQAVREAFLGFGSRLVAEGRLDAAADVFLLDRHELRNALGRDHGRGLQALVGRRRKELDEAAARTPELVVGAPPSENAEPDPIFEKFYGRPGEQRGDGAHLIGYGASPGRASGTALVVRSAADLGRVSAGDVLVCTTTTPSWTPVFGSLAGVVTDTGGILCHAAVVAREYGLPAVVGAHLATSRIAEGSRVTLDGSTGDVWIG
jgi:pyruvate,water dikinase